MSNIVTNAIQRLSHLFAVSFAAAILSSCTATTEGIRIRLVDADTEKDIENAVVVYELHAATDHGTNYTQKAIYETVSNDRGWVEIPPQTINTVVTSGLRPPTLMIFKSDYDPEFLSNGGPIIPTLQDVLRWRRNGQIIKLKRPESFQKYAEKIDFLHRELEHLYDWPNDNPCGWKAIPRMLAAVDKQGRLFRKHNVYSDFPDIDHLNFQDECGSAREFLKEFLDEGNNPPPDKPQALPPRHVPRPQMMYGPPEGFVPPKSK